jgi:glucosamine--fructose-6-phosphate aminotransferase (isomerizing)
MSHLRDEILEQPAVLERVLAHSRAQVRAVVQAITLRPPTAVVVVGRGSADHAATYARYLLEAYTHLPVALATPSLYTAYRRPPHLEHTLVLGISDTGQAPDVVEIVREGRRQGALTAAITNDAGSPLAQAAALVIEQQAGADRMEAATKTYTSQLLIIALLAAELSGDMALEAGVWRVPEAVERALGLEAQAAALTPQIAAHRDCLTLARGFNYATALELALKLKEVGGRFAAPYSADDFTHGPAALAEPGLPALIIGAYGPVESELLDLARRLQESEACILPISDDPALLALAAGPACGISLVDALAGIPEPLSPLVSIVPGQLLALHVGLHSVDEGQAC